MQAVLHGSQPLRLFNKYTFVHVFLNAVGSFRQINLAYFFQCTIIIYETAYILFIRTIPNIYYICETRGTLIMNEQASIEHKLTKSFFKVASIPAIVAILSLIALIVISNRYSYALHNFGFAQGDICLLYTSPSPRDRG